MSKRTFRTWTEDEVFFLRESYADIKWRFKDICVILNRSQSSVNKKAKALGIVNITPRNYPVPEGSKLCRRCLEVKNHNEFYSHIGNYDGVNSYCISCSKDIKNERKIKEIQMELDKREQEKQSYIDSFKGVLITCTKCKEEKTIQEFSVSFKNGTFKRHHWCKKCSAKKTQETTIKKLQEKGHD